MTILRLLCAVLFLSAALPSFAQTGVPADLDSYVQRSMKTFGVPGIAVAVVKDGKVVLQRGYGVRKIGDPAPVDENTLFGIGSNTKAFTVAALATLVDAGKLSWDDPVYERLHDFQMYDPYVSKEMRIRDLLSHRGGLGLGEGDLMLWPHNSRTRDDIVHQLRYLKPTSSFRSQFAYNNLMFIAAGQIVAEMSGKSWDDYLREKIFLPLGMTHTNTTNRLYRGDANWALPNGKDFPLEDYESTGAAGSINSSVADMSRWLLAQLNCGKIPGAEARIFSEKSCAEMWKQHSIIPITDKGLDAVKALRPSFYGYGLGWFLQDYKGRKLVGHHGGVGGFVTRTLLVPEENLGVVVLTNATETYAYESILFHILDGYFGGPAGDYVTAYKAVKDKEQKDAAEVMRKAQQTRAANSKPSLALEKYAGNYSDPWFGKVIIRRENGGLILNWPLTETGTADLQHWQYDIFQAHWRNHVAEDAYVTFTLNPDGSIDHFTMAAISPLADFSSDYQDLYFTPLATEK